MELFIIQFGISIMLSVLMVIVFVNRKRVMLVYYIYTILFSISASTAYHKFKEVNGEYVKQNNTQIISFTLSLMVVSKMLNYLWI